MAENEEHESQSNGSDRSNGSGGGRHSLVRAAALAAASGATAVVARRAFEHTGGDAKQRSQPDAAKPRRGDESVLGSVLQSSWDAARDSLVPLAEEAADHAGRFVAESAPDFVRDSIVPRFISSFEKARGK
jgi:hypothetical protein